MSNDNVSDKIYLIILSLGATDKIRYLILSIYLILSYLSYDLRRSGRFASLVSTFRAAHAMLSAQTATLAATTLVAVALAFYLLSKSSPEDAPATAAPPESVPAVQPVPIAAAPPEAVRTKSMSYAPRSAAAPTEPPARNGQAAAAKPAVPKNKKSEGEEDGGKKRSKAAEAKAAAEVKAAEAEVSTIDG